MHIVDVFRFMNSTSVSWEILNLAHKLKVILDHLQNQMRICREIIGESESESESEFEFEFEFDLFFLTNDGGV